MGRGRSRSRAHICLWGARGGTWTRLGRHLSQDVGSERGQAGKGGVGGGGLARE